MLKVVPDEQSYLHINKEASLMSAPYSQYER